MSSTGPRRHPFGTSTVAAFVVLVAATFGFALTPGGGGSGVAAANTVPGQSPAPLLRLLEQTPYLGPDGVFSMRLAVESPPAGAQIVFRQHADVASSGRDRFTETLAGDDLGRLDRTIRVALDQLPADASGARAASFPIAEDRVPPFGGLQLSGPGVYPLSVTLETADGADVDRFTTYIVIFPADDDPEAAWLTAGVVVPARAAPALQPGGEVQIPQAERDRVGGILRAVAAHPESPVTLVATPEFLAALADTDGADQDAVRNVGDATDLVVGTYVDLQLGAWLDEGLRDELTRQFMAGASTLGDVSGRDPDVGSWLVDPSTTPSALDWLAAAGVSRLAVPADRLAELGGGGRFGTMAPFEIEAPGGARLRALAGEPGLAAHVGGDDPVLDAHHTVADLAMLYFQEPGIPRAVGLLLPDVGVDAAYLDALLEALGPDAVPASGTPPRRAVRGASLPGAIDAAPAATGDRDQVGATDSPLVRTLTPGDPGNLGTYPTQLSFAEASLAGYRSMLPPSELGRMVPLEQLVLVSGARSLDTRGRQDYLDATVAQVDAAAASLTLPPQPRITVTEETVELTLIVDNAADYPLQAELTLTSDKLDFPDGATQVVTLQPGSNRIPVDVSSRSSGAFPITVTLEAPDGSIAIASTRFTVRSTAVSGIGLVLSIGAGVFLLLWWVRHFRSTRAKPGLVRADERARVAGDPA